MKTIQYRTYNGFWETENDFIEFEFPACDWDAMVADLTEGYGPGKAVGVSVR